jgi:hypothetical protein
MHSSKINNTQFHYNSDMSGEVHIIVKGKEIKVESGDLIEFVLDRLRDEKIGQLEQMQTEDLKKSILNAL